MTRTERRIAMELLASADALRECALTIERLDRSGFPGVAGTGEAAAVRLNTRLVSDALVTLATRLAKEGT
jgi:hypothetical protein